jgi:hypothetical protein
MGERCGVAASLAGIMPVMYSARESELETRTESRLFDYGSVVRKKKKESDMCV